MDRREAIKQLAFLTGGALSMSTVAAIMGGCTSESGSAGLKTLSNRQNEMVTVISELIIPETDTPGAKTAKVNQFIDKMLTDWFYKEEREHFLTGLENIDKISNSKFNSSFLDLDKGQQTKILEQLQKESSNNSNPPTNPDLPHFWDMMKELTIVGYYTSETGATQELQANIIPGYYEACMPYEEVGKAWSGAGS